MLHAVWGCLGSTKAWELSGSRSMGVCLHQTRAEGGVQSLRFSRQVLHWVGRPWRGCRPISAFLAAVLLPTVRPCTWSWCPRPLCRWEWRQAYVFMTISLAGSLAPTSHTERTSLRREGPGMDPQPGSPCLPSPQPEPTPIPHKTEGQKRVPQVPDGPLGRTPLGTQDWGPGPGSHDASAPGVWPVSILTASPALETGPQAHTFISLLVWAWRKEFFVKFCTAWAGRIFLLP